MACPHLQPLDRVRPNTVLSVSAHSVASTPFCSTPVFPDGSTPNLFYNHTNDYNFHFSSIAHGCLIYKATLKAMRGMSQQVIRHSAPPGTHVCFLCLLKAEVNFQPPTVVSSYLEWHLTLSMLFELFEAQSPHLHSRALYLPLLSRFLS